MKTTLPAMLCLMLGAATLTPLTFGSVALADSGQLRDPTRCGQGPANCRKMPPRESDQPRVRDAERKEQRKSGSPSLQRTSPLPSEDLQRTPSPGSTGLDKGSTGLSNDPD